MDIGKLTIKRINADFKLFHKSNSQYFDILPNKDNILEIYFLMYGYKDTDYEGGEYICKIVHNQNYPIKAPDYYVLTPNGRFNINQKICLTNSSFHQHDWSPVWNLLTILQGFASIWHSEIEEDKHGISHIYNTNKIELKRFATESKIYNQEKLGEIYNLFPKVILNYNPTLYKEIEEKKE